MSKLTYWEKRQVQNMYSYMQSAEDTADEIAELYYRASRYLSYSADDIFEKFRTKYGLSDAEARRLINTLHDKTSLDELLQKLKNAETNAERQELLKELEAPAYQARLERLRQLQNSIDLVMQTVYQQEKLFSTNFYVDLANEAYYRGIFGIQQQADAAFSFNHVDEKQIDRMLNSKWSGKNYSERIWTNTQNLAGTLKEELLFDLVTGRTNRETAEIIANKFGQGASNARRLVRTESNYISSEMNFAAYQECGIKEYQFLATLDLRTSKVCRELDGKIFRVKDRKVGVNCNPMHPWCRSTTISVVDRELVADMQRSAVDPSTGKRIKVPRSMTYEQWYEKYVKGKPEAELEEKKTKNYSSDQAQHKKYREVLGNHVPKKLDDFQNMKYNEPEKWRFVKLDYQRRNTLIQHPELKLPNAENAAAAEAKFTKYLFGGEHSDGLAKGRAFESRLGFSESNWLELRQEILSSAPQYPAMHKGNVGHGNRYEQQIVLYGKKEKPANVLIAWSDDTVPGEIKMVSVYITEVK